ncbi:Zinc finger, FYVE/PHD-type [Parasponia andersonii]|uniref:Zinc finger, FYVE/PHD-type n=1 Tax=Parasponia andersonii TaxID=3476 RepID=A0A2P5E3F6_PARAD|nr:Zinc finger, FYVE/PHD-type [Parasponia andersonii]
MEQGVRSGGSSGVVVKNRNSSGCLIVRRKGDGSVGGGGGGLGSSSSGKDFTSKKDKKRQRLVMSDSGSSDELLAPPRRRVGPETIRVCNDLTSYGKGVVEESEIGRKRERFERIQHNEDGFISRNDLNEGERKRSKLDVFDFNEYDSIDGERLPNHLYDDSSVDFGGRRFLGSMHMARSSTEREFETGSSRHVVDKRNSSYFERISSTSRGNNCGKGRFEITREDAQVNLLRDKFIGHSDQAIRLQGKNGVLKVLVNKKKNLGGSLEKYNFHKAEEHLKVSRIEDTAKKNVLIPPFYSEEKILEKPGSVVRSEKKPMNSRKSLPTKNSKKSNWHSEDSDTSLKSEPESVVANKSKKSLSCEGEDAPSCEKLHSNKVKEGKVRRGSGTEKQKLRERIRGLLVDAGWTIDYRPRRNRDYLDAVYINPSGTAYWSIIKAYDALQKQLNDEVNETKPSGDGVGLIADEDLCQLTRKTRKKIEKEMKKKQRYGSDSENAKEKRVKRSKSTKQGSESMDSFSHDEKLSSFIKQGGRSFKNRMNENGFLSGNSNGQNSSHHLHDVDEKVASGSNPSMLHGRKSRKLGRCTLLVRSSNKGLNSETDGFVPYTGKRTLLSWLIDSGTVQLSQKVQYKNRRRTRVMLEGWITRDGIHCGCCSKILTISKFEIHAGSKLRQPYQNIFLDSGVSLLQCQMDAWNRQEDSENIVFHSVDTDGDDPNDDTCGICGDGGDLICCDGCPSTFHQSCLGIQMLPPGDWHCPNCTCKFCGIASENVGDEDDTTLLTCSLYHNSCVPDPDVSSINCNSGDACFCGQKCKELFEHLQKFIGIKHDLEAGYSWSLICRTDEDSDFAHRGVPQRVECNSKLAVAMTIMDECFLPIVDRRSGINLIRNVLYNCGSNFNRINYGGFYTAILERGDELICAASIRFHGTKLAEMPFIGTRHIYRRQGMCRRLFCAIESALCSLKVEKLIIPAISELTHTWTVAFGFTPLETALKREMRSINMLVFPGIDMLQKLLGEQEHEANMIPSKGMKMECVDKPCIKPEVAVKSDIDSSTKIDSRGCDDDTDVHHSSDTTEEVAVVESGSQFVDVSNDTPLLSGSLNASPEHKNPGPIKKITCYDSPEAKICGATSERMNLSPSKMIHDALMVENKPVSDLPESNESLSHGPDVSLKESSLMSSSNEASCEMKTRFSNEGTMLFESHSRPKCVSESKCLPLPDGDILCKENNQVFNSSRKDNSVSLKEDGTDDPQSIACKENNQVLDSSLKDNSWYSKEDGTDDSQYITSEENIQVLHSSLKDNTESLNGDGTDDSQNIANACLVPCRETLAENASEEVMENPDVSASSLNGPSESSLLIKADLDNQIDCDNGKPPKEAASDAMNCE